MAGITLQTFNEDDIVDWLGEAEVAKGRAYVDLVSDIHVEEQEVTATVPGSARRPYRTSVPHRLAMEELVRCTGKQFDPVVSEAFQRLYFARAPDFPELRSGLEPPEKPQAPEIPKARRSPRAMMRTTAGSTRQ